MATSLKTFLWDNRVNSNNSKITTHTRIGKKHVNFTEDGWEIHGGKFNIEEDNINTFYKLYVDKVFINKQPEYLTETQAKKKGPLLVDLDFRFNPDVEERQHDEGFISDLIGLYAETLQKYLNLEGQEINFFIFEKPNINTDYKNTKGYVKDGIHMLVTICIDHSTQMFIRDKILEIIEPQLLESLEITNNATDVLDECISKGEVNWQLFGSRKPDNESYQLTYQYSITFQGTDERITEEMDIDDWDFEDIDQTVEFLQLVSAKNDKHFAPDIFDEYKDDVNKIKKRKKVKKIKKIKKNKITTENTIEDVILSQGAFGMLVQNIGSQETLDNYINKLIINDNSETDTNFNSRNENIKEVHNYTMLLTEEFYSNYPQWIKIGWALHNTDDKCILTWIKFSSNWTGWDWATGPAECWEKWENMREIGYSDRTIKYFARQCDEEGAAEIYNSTLKYLIKQTLNTSFEDNINGFDTKPQENDIARLCYHMFKDYFRCCSISKNIWYEFRNNRWIENDSGVGLRRQLTDTISKLYVNECNLMMRRIREEDPQQEQVGTKSLIQEGNIYNQIAQKLKTKSYKDAVMKENQEQFYDSAFVDKLNGDHTKTLLCFKNGVYDFEKQEFRNGIPEDYISKCTNTKYIEIDRNNDVHLTIIRECEDFMEKLFPIPTLRRYMWDNLSSCLLGTTHDQTIHFWNNPNGRNGKSKLREFLNVILGEYAGTLPVTMITQKRKQIGSTTSEVAKLVGVRFVCMDEPSKNDHINEGILKQLTGGDPLTARALYKDAIEFVPQFKLACCTNHMPEIKSTDGGTWRRIRKVEFMSTFKSPHEKISEDIEDYEFLADEKIGKKFKKWAPIFTSLLIENAVKKKLWENKVAPCDEVTKASREYQERSDYLTLFLNEKIIKATNTDKISKTHITEVFKQWYNNMYPGERVPGIQELTDFLNKKLGKYKRQGWWGWKIQYDNYNDEADVESDEEA